MFILHQNVEVIKNGIWYPGKITAVEGSRYYVKYEPPGPQGVPPYGEEVPIAYIRGIGPRAAALPISRAATMPMAAITYRTCDDFNYPIQFLKECERLRKWDTVRGDLSATCGYTAPGIGLIVLLFERNKISDEDTLYNFLKVNARVFGSERTRKCFIDIVNETTGNFLDLINHNPVTQTSHGIMGLISKTDVRAARPAVPNAMDIVDTEIESIYRVNDSIIVRGVNAISFKIRNQDSTFHHSALYAKPEENICFILDSWYNNDDGSCRQITCRQFTFNEVRDALVRLNSEGCLPEEAEVIFRIYFLAPKSFLKKIKKYESSFFVYVLNQEYIKEIYTECERRIMEGQCKSNFGGTSCKKKNIKTKKLHKKRDLRNKKSHARRYIRSKKFRTRRQIRGKYKVF
jgi:hypothetical protein